MGCCVFKTSEIKRCVMHALGSTDFRMVFSPAPPGPGLIFVHDDGVYLMSNGLPLDPLTKDPDSYSYVAYAANCNPKKDPEWWDNSRELVGGDDFGEIIKVDLSWLQSCDEFEELQIEVEPSSIGVYFARPKKNKKPVKI